jgi:hypothetical protein
MNEPVKVDWRRAVLQLPQFVPISKNAICASYWRIVGHAHPSNGGHVSDFEQARQAKRELLTEAGVRIPPPRRR